MDSSDRRQGFPDGDNDRGQKTWDLLSQRIITMESLILAQDER